MLNKFNLFISAIIITILISTLVHGDTIADHNIYLEELVEWDPGEVGPARANYVIAEDGYPIQNNLALGAPTGNGSWSRVYDCTAVGINGSAAWRFEEGYYIYNGPGNDFITFEGSFAWGGAVDGLCCELAHVQVSIDGINWYYNSAEAYDINPDPDQSNGNYQYFNVSGMHGNNPTWANYTKDMQAQEIQEVDGVFKWVNVEGVMVSKDFLPTDPYLGGNGFDLSTFLAVADDSAWPEDGKMQYIKIIDDSSVLDGQDYNKAWCFGAQMHAAMAINAMKISPVPIPGAILLFGSGLLALIGLKRKES
ncbi:MAG: hypothetical protein PVG39_30165 [Desulfobacteraceae bacterium]|jgi:hypothetical protein